MVTAEEIASLILGREGFVNREHAAGSIIAGAGKAWRFTGAVLEEVPLAEYRRALEAPAPEQWPPYTITFVISPAMADDAVTVEVSTLYDGGMTEESRGGNDTVWTVRRRGSVLEVTGVEYLMFWD